jgi:hypothetical protein
MARAYLRHRPRQSSRRLLREMRVHRVMVVSLALLWAAPAFADGPIATSSPAQAKPPQSAAGAPPLADASDSAVDGPRVVMGPCGPTKARPDGSPDHAAHGVVEAGVGTHGYRHVALAACKPIGDNAAVAVSISQSDYGGGGGRRR